SSGGGNMSYAGSRVNAGSREKLPGFSLLLVHGAESTVSFYGSSPCAPHSGPGRRVRVLLVSPPRFKEILEKFRLVETKHTMNAPTPQPSRDAPSGESPSPADPSGQDVRSVVEGLARELSRGRRRRVLRWLTTVSVF